MNQEEEFEDEWEDEDPEAFDGVHCTICKGIIDDAGVCDCSDLEFDQGEND